jgi:hypothetical protein
MAKRQIFLAKNNKPFYSEYFVDFTWNSGFAKSQKQKNIKAIHEIYQKSHPNIKLLEISSASLNFEGIELSAFNLPIIIGNNKMTVECAFQGSKVFSNGGPYIDLYRKSSKEAKKDLRLKTSGDIIGFELYGIDYPNNPKTAFYDWIYFNACKQSKKAISSLIKYNGFTDIAFNPEKSLNCQARSAAIIVGLFNAGLFDKINSFDDFVSIVY